MLRVILVETKESNKKVVRFAEESRGVMSKVAWRANHGAVRKENLYRALAQQYEVLIRFIRTDQS
jgi:hypothetical protein